MSPDRQRGLPARLRVALARRPVDGRRAGASSTTDERGAVLILALIMLIVGTLIVGGLTYEVTNNIQDSTRFKAARSLQYAARSATNLAIQNIRYAPLLVTTAPTPSTLNASPPVPCWQNTAGTNTISEVSNIDGIAEMATWCSTIWTPTSADTRTVTISTCLGPVNVPTASQALALASQCAGQPLLQAVIAFDDYPNGQSVPASAQCVTFCGTGMTTVSWTWSPTIPVVTGVSPTTGTTAGGTQVTITGSGFVAGSTVNFVEESGGAPTQYPNNFSVVIPACATPPATVVEPCATVNSATSITVPSPSVTAGSTYFVSVSTPIGTSAECPEGSTSPAQCALNAVDVFTYSTIPPTVTSITPNTGSIAGGSSVTLNGTGFLTNALVKFVPESGGTPTGAGVPGNNVDVISSTTLTVVSPGVTSGTTYFITVSTPAGTSPSGASTTFTYTPLDPTTNVVSPNTGSHTTTTAVVITGTGFVVGATVSISKVSNGCPTQPGNQAPGAINVSGATVVNSSTIDVTLPAETAGPYYIYVTSPSGTSGCYPIFTYS